MLDHHLCRNWKQPILLGATALCLMMGSGQSEAACTNPPVIGWPEGNVPALTGQTPTFLEIQYHDQCSGEQSTYVQVRQARPSSVFTRIKNEGFNQGGWRRASQSGLTPDTAYEFEVGVVGSDQVLRKVNRTFSTLKDPALEGVETLPGAENQEAVLVPTPKVDCTPEETEWVRAPIAKGAPRRHYSVYLACNLKLDPVDPRPVQKRIILEGDDASGVTIDCNDVTLDGGRDTPNKGNDMIEIKSRSYIENKGENRRRIWEPVRDVLISDCKVIGSIRIWGMAKNGEGSGSEYDDAEEVLEDFCFEGPFGISKDCIPRINYFRASSHRVGHTARARANAPTRITLDNLKITATARTPLYLAPGVTYVTLVNSELNGNGTRTAIYLDTESAYNVIKNNSIHVKIFDEWPGGVFNRLGPQISIDNSSNNQIINNHFSALEGGGVYLYRNCGEGGTVRHGTPSDNQIINNVFYYRKYKGDNAAVMIGSRGYDEWWRVHCDDDDGFPWGSSADNRDFARNNVVMQNKICKRSVEDMIRQGDSSNRPNFIRDNETITCE